MKCEDELRDMVVIEVVLYLIVVEYISFFYKVYIFVCCLVRFYVYVYKNCNLDRYVSVVRNVV